MNDTAEGSLHPVVDPNDWMPIVNSYREAFAKQLLIPVPDVAAVNWKRSVLARNDHVIGRRVKKERVEAAIAADVEWLEAHPTRKSIAASPQARKGD